MKIFSWKILFHEKNWDLGWKRCWVHFHLVSLRTTLNRTIIVRNINLQNLWQLNFNAVLLNYNDRNNLIKNSCQIIVCDKIQVLTITVLYHYNKNIMTLRLHFWISLPGIPVKSSGSSECHFPAQALIASTSLPLASFKSFKL